MSVFFRLHQDKSVGTKRSGKWYARMVPMGVIDTRRLAEIVQRNCTVKKSDVLAETMRDQMQDGKRVKLDGFGSFKIGLQCHGAANAKEFSVGENIDGVHVVFSPERSTDAAGNRTKQFLQDVQLEELPENKVEKKESGD